MQKIIFTNDLLLFLKTNLNKNETISNINPVLDGVHYTIELDEKVKEENYLDAKKRILNLLLKCSFEKDISIEIEFIKQHRGVCGIGEESTKKLLNTVDVMILSKKDLLNALNMGVISILNKL